MSLRYEVTFSLFLRDDTPTSVLDELRWHLGLSSTRPAVRALGYDQPQMVPGDPTYLPGYETAALRRQHRFSRGGTDHYAWGLHARLYWRGDQWAEMWWQIAQWLAGYADSNGYAGSFREQDEENLTTVIVRDSELELID